MHPIEKIKDNFLSVSVGVLKMTASVMAMTGLPAEHVRKLTEDLNGTENGVDKRLSDTWLDVMLEEKEQQGVNIGNLLVAPATVQTAELLPLHIQMMNAAQIHINAGMDRFHAQSLVLNDMQESQQVKKQAGRVSHTIRSLG